MSKRTALASLINTQKQVSNDLKNTPVFLGTASYRKILPAQIALICHASAKDAYLAWESVPKRTHSSAVLAQLKNHLYSIPVSLSKDVDSGKNCKTYYFWNGFEAIQHFRLCIDKSVEIPILLIQELAPEIIKLQAWTELTKLIFTNSVDPRMGSVCLLNSINEQMPPDIMNTLIGTTNLSVTDFRDLHGLTSTQYENQLKNWQAFQELNKKPSVNISFASILGQSKCRD
jgi:hypothetical protein